MVYIYYGILPSYKKNNEIIPFAAAWMQLEIIILNEVNSEGERPKPYDITYVWNLKYDTNESIYETETESQTQNRLVVAKRIGGGGRMEWEVEVSRYKLLYIEWIKNKALLYNTKKYIQYPMTNHNGENIYKKEYVSMYYGITLLYSRN